MGKYIKGLLFGLALSLTLFVGVSVAQQEIDRSTLAYVQILNGRADTLGIVALWPDGSQDLGKVPPQESRVHSLPAYLPDGVLLKLQITLGNGYRCVTTGSVALVGGEVLTLRMFDDGPLAESFCRPVHEPDEVQRQA